ncbi:sugar kinase [Streptomyces sp. NPDC048665]|uniref:sugar kinase n=1 Tax=Streptomyces sp. NPDC048665 TaxID=3155490 RepID=UPI0034491F97
MCARTVPHEPVDVVTLGESMVTFLPSHPGRLADVPSFDRAIGGAESNVACVLAAAGHSARWVSRVGADGFGQHLVERIAGYGVDTSAVGTDALRPTGIYFRTAGDRGTGAHEVAYYRTGSAASVMSAGNVDLGAARAGRVLHLSGITAALSPECRELMHALTAPRAGRPLLSFDVNHRPGLWRTAEGPLVLLDLARRVDIVFVGEDEAEQAWGIKGGPEAVRAALPEPDVLVVKQGARGATAFASHRPPVFEPALRVEVVATTGAGDAFAAGFLSATLRGLPLPVRLRHGHLFAAAALTTPGDLAPPPARDHADRLSALGGAAWGRLRLGPGWTQADVAEQEANTP